MSADDKEVYEAQLPPGCRLCDNWGDTRHPMPWAIVFQDGYECWDNNSTKDDDLITAAIDASWKRWEKISGLTRDAYESMARDHRAMEMVRERNLYIEPEIADYSDTGDGSDVRYTGKWLCEQELGDGSVSSGRDPAEAALAYP